MSREVSRPDTPPQAKQSAEPVKQEDEDFYMDGPYCVFTAAFHLRRGFCCGSGCRHCPYDENGEPRS